MYNKVLAVLAFAALVKCHDLAIGSNTSGRKIFDETKQASPAIWRQDNNVTVSTNDNEVISRVIVHDLRSEKDGDVKIIEGGEGHKNVTLELKSPTALRGYEFHIQVYAIPDQKSNDQGSSTMNSMDISMDSTTNVPSKDNAPAIIAKDENPRPVRTIMTEDKDNNNINMPIAVNEFTTEAENKESTDVTTEASNSDESNEENMKKSKEDAETHEVVDFVLEDTNQSEKAALTSDSLKKEENPMELARDNNPHMDDDDKMETTTQSDDITSTPSEDDYGKIDFDSSKVPSIVLKMEPPTDKEMPSDWSKHESRFEVPLMKHLGN